MDWDPKTAIVLYQPYQPIDIYPIACKEVLKSIHQTKIALDKISDELTPYQPKEISSWLGRKVIVVKSGAPGSENLRNKDVTLNKIQKLEGIKSSLDMVAKDFSQSIQRFDTTFILEIRPVEHQIGLLNEICSTYLLKQREVYDQQTKMLK